MRTCPLNPDCKNPNYEKHNTKKPAKASPQPKEKVLKHGIFDAKAKDTVKKVIKDVGPNKNIKEMFELVGPQYEHTLFENGGAGHCLYYSISSALQCIGYDIDYVVLRSIVADYIRDMPEPELIALYIQEYNKLKLPSVDNMRSRMATATMGNRWGTEFDISVICNTLNIGIFLFDGGTGGLYNMSREYNYFPNYIVLVNDDGGAPSKSKVGVQGAHYRTVGIRLKGIEETYRVCFKCNELPQILIDLLKLNDKPLFRC